MLVPAVAFSQFVVAVHIAAVIVAFGVSFAYPVMYAASERLDRGAVPWFHRLQQAIGRRVVNPGLLVVLVAGIYLASDAHQWKAFFVQWGFAIVIVLGGLEGSYMIPRAGKLAELADRDLAAGTSGWSEEYVQLRKRVGAVGGAMSLLVLVTVYLMTVQSGA